MALAVEIEKGPREMLQIGDEDETNKLFATAINTAPMTIKGLYLLIEGSAFDKIRSFCCICFGLEVTGPPWSFDVANRRCDVFLE